MAEERSEARREPVRKSWQDYEGSSINRPDWWGRLMAFGAMLLAGAALLNSMGGLPNFLSKGADLVNGAAEQADAGVGAIKTGLAGESGEPEAHLVAKPVTGEPAAAEQVAAHDTETANKITKDDDSHDDQGKPVNETSLDNDDDYLDDVNELFAEQGATRLPNDDTSDLSKTKAAADKAVEDIEPTVKDAEDGLLELDVLDKDPQLQIVHTALRPSVDQATAAITIENTGSGPALITDALFLPAKVVELPLDVAAGKVGLTDSTKLVVAFTSDDNLAKQPGRHANYRRELRIPYTIEAGETVQVHVAIEDDDFVGYGFDGDLRLIFNESEKLEVSGVTIAFVN